MKCSSECEIAELNLNSSQVQYIHLCAKTFAKDITSHFRNGGNNRMDWHLYPWLAIIPEMVP